MVEKPRRRNSGRLFYWAVFQLESIAFLSQRSELEKCGEALFTSLRSFLIPKPTIFQIKSRPDKFRDGFLFIDLL